jgi:hypothetical protein
MGHRAPNFGPNSRNENVVVHLLSATPEPSPEAGHSAAPVFEVARCFSELALGALPFVHRFVADQCAAVSPTIGIQNVHQAGANADPAKKFQSDIQVRLQIVI